MIGYPRWVQGAPDEVLTDALTYWANRRYLYNKGIITLLPAERRALLDFQKAAAKNGIDKDKFNSYVTIK